MTVGNSYDFSGISDSRVVTKINLISYVRSWMLAQGAVDTEPGLLRFASY
ncbi:MAG: hypothetical protein ACI4VX_06425 [Succinivibrionaceae bacterium]